MKTTDFVWADLSTFRMGNTQSFYTVLFGWRYEGTSDYTFAHIGATPTAGLFTMPEKFQQMGLPSFWMSYITVADIVPVVERARAAGAIVEVEPTAFDGGGQIALIRDTAGAGFTIWTGDTSSKSAGEAHGHMVRNELHVSNAATVIPFYASVFGWSFVPVSASRYAIKNEAGRVIAALEEIPNEIKGKFEYWAVYFAVKDLDHAIEAARSRGGTLTTIHASPTGRVAQLQDPDGAMFMLLETGSGSRMEGADMGGPGAGRGWWSAFKLRTIVALVVIYVAVGLNLTWAWGLLFLVWLIPDLRSGHTYLVEPIDRRTNPILSWFIMISWIWMAIYLLLGIFTG